MQTISATALSILRRGGKLGVSITCDGIVDLPITITHEDVIQGSFYVDRNSVSGSNIEIGNADTTEVGFALNNATGKFDGYTFEGANLSISLIIGAEYLKLGEFVVDEPPKKLKQISIRSLDYMAKFNKEYVSDYTGTRTLLQLFTEACTKCGVATDVTSFTNDSHLATVPSGENLTYHQVIMWIAELSGNNAWIDPDGKLRLSWYGENQGIEVIDIDPADRFTYNIDENDIQITGIIYKESEQIEYSFPPSGNDYALVFEGNKLVSVEDDDFNTVLNAVVVKVVGFTYRPFNFDVIGYPHLHPMDELTISPPTGADIISYITNHRYVLNGKSAISAKGETAVRSGYASMGQFTTTQKRIIENTSSIIANTKVSTLQQETLNLNQLITNSMGYHETILIDPLTGANKRYVHSGTTLALSKYIYEQTETGFRYSMDGDVNPYPNNTWASGMTADGNIVGRTLSVWGINAEWIDAGVVDAQHISIDGTSTFGTGYDPSVVQGNLTSLINSMGDMAYEDLVESAKLGSTVIVGGFINSSLLTADNILVGTLSASLIGANTIKTDQLNVLARNLVNNYTQTNSLEGWTQTDGSLYLSSEKNAIVHKVTTTYPTRIIYSDRFFVDPTKTYKVTLSVYCSSADGARYFGLDTYDVNDAEISSSPFLTASRTFGSDSTNVYFWSKGGTTGGWIEIETYILGCNVTEPEIPIGKNANFTRMLPNCTQVRLRYLNYGTDGVSRTAYFYSPTVTEVGIGTIHANSIVTGKITSTDGDTWFDLDNSQIRSKELFTSPRGDGTRTTIMENGMIDILCETPFVTNVGSVGDELVRFLEMEVQDSNAVKYGKRLLTIAGYFDISPTTGEMTAGHVSIGASADGTWQSMEIPIHLTEPVVFVSQIVPTIDGGTAISVRNGKIALANTAGDTSSVLSLGNQGALIVNTNYGSLTIGAQNSTYCHFQTSLPQFYFSQPVITPGYFKADKTSGLALSSINATNSSDDAWNSSSNFSLFVENSNNALSVIVSGISNDRKAMIQVGHNTTSYASALGELQLNPLGGLVTVNGSAVSVAGHTHNYLSNANNQWLLDEQGNERIYMGSNTITTNQFIFKACNASGSFQLRNSANLVKFMVDMATGGILVGSIGIDNVGGIQIATGTVTLTSASWTTGISFGKTFSGIPKVTISPVTATAGVIAPKVNSVTTSTFSATIGGSGFSSIVCHWIAIYYP